MPPDPDLSHQKHVRYSVSLISRFNQFYQSGELIALKVEEKKKGSKFSEKLMGISIIYGKNLHEPMDLPRNSVNPSLL